jgi:hypothetical protein
MEVSFELLTQAVSKLTADVESCKKNYTEFNTITPSVSNPNQEKKPSNRWLLWAFELAISGLPDEFKTKIHDLLGIHYTTVWMVFTLAILFLLIRKNN